jgi:hypothetical protein
MAIASFNSFSHHHGLTRREKFNGLHSNRIECQPYRIVQTPVQTKQQKNPPSMPRRGERNSLFGAVVGHHFDTLRLNGERPKKAGINMQQQAECEGDSSEMKHQTLFRPARHRGVDVASSPRSREPTAPLHRGIQKFFRKSFKNGSCLRHILTTTHGNEMGSCLSSSSVLSNQAHRSMYCRIACSLDAGFFLGV